MTVGSDLLRGVEAPTVMSLGASAPVSVSLWNPNALDPSPFEFRALCPCRVTTRGSGWPRSIDMSRLLTSAHY